MNKATRFIIYSADYELRTRLFDLAKKFKLPFTEYSDYSMSGDDCEKAIIVFDGDTLAATKILKYFYRERARIPDLYFCVFINESHIDSFSVLFEYADIAIFPKTSTGGIYFDKRFHSFMNSSVNCKDMKNEKLFDTTLEKLDSIAIVVDEKSFITNIYGKTDSLLIDAKEHLIGSHIRDYIPMENSAVLHTLIKESIAQGIQRSACINIAGEFRDLIIYPNGSGAVLVSKNVDEREIVAGKLSNTESILQSLIGRSPVGIWIVDSNGIIRYAEGAIWQDIGVVTSEFLGTSIFALKNSFKDFVDNIGKALSGTLSAFESRVGNKYYDTSLSKFETPSLTGIIGVSIECTQRKTAELELEKNKLRLELALQSSGIGLWDMELDSGDTYFSPEVSKLFELDENTPFSWTELGRRVHQDDWDVYENFHRDIVQNVRYDSDFELKVKSSVGGDKWLRLLTKVAKPDASSAAKRLIGIMEDVSERKRYERLLSDSEARLKSIINSSGNLIILFDTNKVVIDFNKKAFESLLVDFGVYLNHGKTFSNIPLLDYQKDFGSKFEKTLNGETIRTEVDYTGIYGYTVWYDVVFTPVKDLAGKVNSVCLFFSPISDRKLFELELRENKATLQAILEASPVGIGLNQSGKFVWANAAFTKIFDFNESIKGVPTSRFFTTNEEFLEFRNKYFPMLLKNGFLQIEYKLKKASGDTIDCLVLARLKSPNNINGDYVVVVMDVSERNKEAEHKEAILKDKIEAEKKRNEALQMVEHSARIASIGLITGGITHEINQPLNAIRVAADGILFWNEKHELVMPDQITNLIRKISGAASRIDDIIRHIRSFWINASKNELFELDLNESTERALTLISQRLLSHDVKLIKKFSSERAKIKSNPLIMELIINNIALNALQSIEEKKSGSRTIEVSTGYDDSIPYLKISDTGIGLPDVNTDLLFDPLFSTKQNKEGTGLGLAIVKMFLSKIGAVIQARNNEQGGAEFTILFLGNKNND